MCLVKTKNQYKDTAASYYLLGTVQHKMGDLKGAVASLQKAANMP